jgi:Rrf2 family protein
MRLSRAAVYAIRASLQLAETPSGEPIPCSRLARAGEMPERYLLQVLRQMVNHGLLKSTRGVDGGYCLQRSAREISLLHVVEATDGPVTSDLPPMDGMPEWSQKRLIRVVQDMTRAVSEQLAKTSLADLCSVSESPGPESHVAESGLVEGGRPITE